MKKPVSWADALTDTDLWKYTPDEVARAFEQIGVKCSMRAVPTNDDYHVYQITTDLGHRWVGEGRTALAAILVAFDQAKDFLDDRRRAMGLPTKAESMIKERRRKFIEKVKGST